MVFIGNPPSKEISAQNSNFVSYFRERLGETPHLYDVMMHSRYALNAYYPFHRRETSLSARELAAIALTTARECGSSYCMETSRMVGKLNGFTEDEMAELSEGTASFDDKLDALVRLTKQMMTQKGSTDGSLLAIFLQQGYSREDLIDLMLAIGDNYTANLVANVSDVPPHLPAGSISNQIR